MTTYFNSKTDRRVIIVEDDPAIAELLHIRVELAGHKARVAKSAGEALDVISAFKPHCVVLDIGLPGRDGFCLLKQLRATRATHDLPVLVLTGRVSETDVRTALALGAEDYVAKPFDDKALLRRIARLLDPALRMPQCPPQVMVW